MSVPPEQFDRVVGRVDVSLLATKLVVIAGIGTVGSQVAREMACAGVGHLRLIDGDIMEESNLVRHVLTRRHIGTNKANAMALYLAGEVPAASAEPVPRYIDDALSDAELDEMLADANLIIAATDDREAQRRLGRRALALDIPAVFPALYGDDGGEVFVQRSRRHPCFFCWDGYRPVDERMRGVSALNADTLPVIQLAVYLSLGVLDRNSEHATLMVADGDDPRPYQLFVVRHLAPLSYSPALRRRDCPACGVDPPDEESMPGPIETHFWTGDTSESIDDRFAFQPHRFRRLLWTFVSLRKWLRLLGDAVLQDLLIVTFLVFVAPFIFLNSYVHGYAEFEHYINSHEGLGGFAIECAGSGVYVLSLFSLVGAFAALMRDHRWERLPAFLMAFAFGFIYVGRLASLVIWGHTMA